MQARELVRGAHGGRGAAVRVDGVATALCSIGSVPTDEARLDPDVHPGALLDDRMGGWANVREVCCWRCW